MKKGGLEEGVLLGCAYDRIQQVVTSQENRKIAHRLTVGQVLNDIFIYAVIMFLKCPCGDPELQDGLSRADASTHCGGHTFTLECTHHPGCIPHHNVAIPEITMSLRTRNTPLIKL